MEELKAETIRMLGLKGSQKKWMETTIDLAYEFGINKGLYMGLENMEKAYKKGRKNG